MTSSSAARRVATRIPAGLTALAILVASPVGRAEEDTAPLTILIDANQSFSALDIESEPGQPTVDMLRQAAGNAGIAVDIRFMPWQRAYRQALTDPGTCLSGLVLTAQRSLLFKWVGPLASPTVSLFGLEHRHLHPLTMAQVVEKGYRLGIAQDDLAEALQARFPHIHIDFLRSQDLGPKMLATGRIDLWAAFSTSGTDRLRRDGIDAEEVLKIMQLDIGLGCGLSVDGAKLMALQAAIVSLKNRHWKDVPPKLGLQARNGPMNRLGAQN